MHLLVNFYIFMPVFIAFYMYFADARPDEPLGKTDRCGLNVYSVAVQIEIFIYFLNFSHCFNIVEKRNKHKKNEVYT